MVYLDYAATYPMLPVVQEAMKKAEQKYFANASALHTPGHLAHNEIEACRKTLANLIGASPSEIIFMSGATECNNTVTHTFEGCQIEISPLEHDSILESAKIYCGNKLPKLYSDMLANNETGEILSLPELQPKPLEYAKLFEGTTKWGKPLVTDKRTAYLHSDLTQALGKIKINVNKLGLDYATLSAHKIGGPVGIAALYVRNGVPFKPLLIGGGQENHRRGGTYNVPAIVGFHTALKQITQNNTIKQYETNVSLLRNSLAKQILAKIPGSSLNTDIKKGKSLPNILNVSFKSAEGESIQLYLDAEGIIVSTGSACASGDIEPSHVLMAKTGDAEIAHSSIRFSFGLESTEKDVQAVMKVLPGIIKRLQGMSTVV